MTNLPAAKPAYINIAQIPRLAPVTIATPCPCSAVICSASPPRDLGSAQPAGLDVADGGQRQAPLNVPGHSRERSAGGVRRDGEPRATGHQISATTPPIH